MVRDDNVVLLNVAGKDGEFLAPMVEPFFWVTPVSFGADRERGQEFGVGGGGAAKGYVVWFLR
jgi:hypothetical protein